MKTLDKKVFREFLALKSQAITITLVVASGIAVFLTSLSAYNSLLNARDRFYADYSLAQGFVSLNKAPNSILSEISKIPGVAASEGRIVKDVVLDFETESVPSGGRVISLTEGLSTLALTHGALPKNKDEVVISDAFAATNLLKVNSKIVAILEGQRKILIVAGIALSPEFVYVFRPSNFLPDDKHYGILWMQRENAEDIFNMQGAINDIVFNFTPDADKNFVLKEVDRLLEPYGGLGSYDRDKLPSHSFLRDKFKQLKTTAFSLPLIFLGVAAFLLHIVSTRIISKQREQIATLKAIGYGNTAIGLHYLKIISLISLLGSVLGIAFGIYLGTKMVALYGEYFKFPKLQFVLDPSLIFQGILIGFAAGGVGSLLSVRNAIMLQPAQAMRPPIPESYSRNFLEGYIKNFSAIYRIMLRNLTRRPGRTFLSILGVSCSVMIMILGLFTRDTMDYILKVQFEYLQRDSVTLNFLNAVSSHSIIEVADKDGVLSAEGFRTVPIRIIFGNLNKELLLMGLPENSELRKLMNETGDFVSPPGDGVLLNAKVAKKLGIKKGDRLQLEILEGKRETAEVEVTGMIDEILGQGAYMEKSSVNRLLREGDLINLMALRTDSLKEEQLLNELKNYPKISGVSTRERTLKIFYDTISKSVIAAAVIIIIFACIISVGVVYNTALIVLSERVFELGSLRILGFTKEEVFMILSGELAIEILLSIPLGCLFGYGFGYALLSTIQTEGFKIPLYISEKTYFIAIMTVLATSAISFWILYLKVKSMDLISVLKIRE
ncbi:MacB-like periplasmic core domain protein [Leptospira broomii serovar Hurstbridge str. 5399]|uniref:MacB-like periplasmic core domain protein n=1 Tax=Leptospira broomii serovar Hurstbridge str. 5399 TaxID=1049789 RepID=T0F6X2_9LEPT|nr:MacB-like periplasmic core domain protein [Leptospira broomii serovar Hurstbridge str. 5399]